MGSSFAFNYMGRKYYYVWTHVAILKKKTQQNTFDICDFRLFRSYLIFFCIWVDIAWSV